MKRERRPWAGAVISAATGLTDHRAWVGVQSDRRSLSAEQEVHYLIREYDVPEDTARVMVVIERGEIDGDTFVVADDDEDWHA